MLVGQRRQRWRRWNARGSQAVVIAAVRWGVLFAVRDLSAWNRRSVDGGVESRGRLVAYPQLIDDLGHDEIATVQREQTGEKDAVVLEIVQNEVACLLPFFLRIEGRHDAQMSFDEMNFLACKRQIIAFVLMLKKDSSSSSVACSLSGNGSNILDGVSPRSVLTSVCLRCRTRRTRSDLIRHELLF